MREILAGRKYRHFKGNDYKVLALAEHTETGEECVAREVLEETGLKVKKSVYQFTLPNIYVYSGFLVHTLDMFFLCTVEDMSHFSAMDDVADSFFLPLSEIHPEDFGLDSIRRGLSLFLAQCR